jgi:DNA-binding protein HU-beta
MNKGDLVHAVAKKAGLTQKDAGKAIDVVFTSIRNTLKKGGRVSLVGFGGFEVRNRKARMGRNPRTGRALTIKARRVPVFRAGKALKEAVNR